MGKMTEREGKRRRNARVSKKREKKKQNFPADVQGIKKSVPTLGARS